MDQVQTLQLSAIETDGKLSVSIHQGTSNEDGQECSRRKVLVLPVIEDACCQECWLDQLLAEVADVASGFAWSYFHSEACGQDHEEPADA